jgi:pimeloyl-ACP methyl ester carboxylesterase
MGSSGAEWWHLAEQWSSEYRVLIYDRLGYGQSSSPKSERTPENVATELKELLAALGIKKLILVGHSLGGLYSYQFARQYPELVQSLILVDPVSPTNSRFKQELTPAEYSKSGVDKGSNMKLGKILCTLGLGKLLIPLLKKAPPFYYYQAFSPEAEKYILQHLTNRKVYATAAAEYEFIERPGALDQYAIAANELNMPLALICHTPEVMQKEIVYYGGTDTQTAEKIDNLWLEIMRVYLNSSSDSHFLQAKNSGHFIHLTDPEVIWKAIKSK